MMNSTQFQNQEGYFIKVLQILNSKKFKSIFLDVIVYLFVMLFVYTAASKLMTLTAFQKALTRYPFLGSYSILISYLVPIAELIASALLVIPKTRKLGIVSSLILMVIFLGYILFMFIFGSDLPCSCGGIVAKLSWQQHIWFNSVLISLASLGLILYRK